MIFDGMAILSGVPDRYRRSMNARVHTAIGPEPLAIEDAYAFLRDSGAGAVVVFTGTVRDHAEGRSVTGLTYEVFADEAAARMAALANEVAATWTSVRAVWMTHRSGVLQVGDPSVVVGVSAEHRPEAFAAARYGIDTLKATVPIWKQEHWADGSNHWPGTD
jgi:molybdopterin synthase catalytic subunit